MNVKSEIGQVGGMIGLVPFGILFRSRKSEFDYLLYLIAMCQIITIAAVSNKTLIFLEFYKSEIQAAWLCSLLVSRCWHQGSYLEAREISVHFPGYQIEQNHLQMMGRTFFFPYGFLHCGSDPNNGCKLCSCFLNLNNSLIFLLRSPCSLFVNIHTRTHTQNSFKGLVCVHMFLFTLGSCNFMTSLH